MPAQTSTLHVRGDDRRKDEAAEGGLPAGLATDPDAYDAWFRAKVREALDDSGPSIPHAEVMAEMRELIASKRRG